MLIFCQKNKSPCGEMCSRKGKVCCERRFDDGVLVAFGTDWWLGKVDGLGISWRLPPDGPTFNNIIIFTSDHFRPTVCKRFRPVRSSTSGLKYRVFCAQTLRSPPPMWQLLAAALHLFLSPPRCCRDRRRSPPDGTVNMVRRASPRSPQWRFADVGSLKLKILLAL